MKQLLILGLALFLLGCNNIAEKRFTLTNDEWKDLFGYTLSSAYGSDVSVFDEFDNEKFRDLLLNVYEACPDLGYSLNDSTINDINIRNNSSISSVITSSTFNIQIVSDTVSFKSNLVVYSEPIILNDSILLVALSIRNKELVSKELAFFFKKWNGHLKIIEYYDSQKKMYFEAAPH
jgi:hypothetical protein